ncbi:MAG: ABC transporter permease [Propionibacteriaceae bacterium]
MRALEAFCTVAQLQFKIAVSHPFNILNGVMGPALWFSLVILPRRFSLDETELTQAIAGVLLASLWASTLWSGAGILRRERRMGVLASSVRGVANPATVLVGKTVGSLLCDLMYISLSLLTYAAVLRVTLARGSAGVIAVGIALVVFSGVCASLLVGSLLLVSRHANHLATALGAPVLLLSGVLVPFSFLPDWVERTSMVLNLTWTHKYFESSLTSIHWPSVMGAVAVSLIYVCVGTLLLRRAIARTVRRGTLGAI